MWLRLLCCFYFPIWWQFPCLLTGPRAMVTAPLPCLGQVGIALLSCSPTDPWTQAA